MSGSIPLMSKIKFQKVLKKVLTSEEKYGIIQAQLRKNIHT